MRIVIVGEESAGAQVVRSVHAAEHEIVAVLASHGTGGVAATVKTLAEKLGLATLPAASVLTRN
jgi:hypothetical protein